MTRNSPTEQFRKHLGQAAILFLVVSTVLSMAAVGAFANPTDEITYGEDAADPVWISVDTLTVAKHPIDEGTSATAMSGYFDDSGDWVNGSDSEFIVNDSLDEDLDDDVEGNRNPYVFDPAYVEHDEYGAFPRVGDDETDNSASALDASEWTALQNSGNVTLSDTTVAANVDALNIDADKGNNNTAVITEVTYGNWTGELDSDESKRVLMLGGEINSWDGTAEVQINVTDESGDYKQVLLDPDATSQDDNIQTAAASTGTFAYQVKLSDLTTNGGGSWDNIEHLNVTVRDGSADVSLSWIDVEKKGKVTLGENVVDDEDDDSDFDNTNTQYNSTGTINVSSVSTLDAYYDDATLTDVQFPAKFRAQDLATEGDDEDYRVSWSTSNKYTRENVLTVEYRLELPALIDLSYSGTDLEMTQAWPDDRYVELSLYEGADGDAFSTIEDDDNYVDQSSNLGTEDEDVTLDSTISTDTEYAVKIISTFTDDEKASIEASGDDTTEEPAATTGGGLFGGGGGGILSTLSTWLFSIPGAIVTGVAGVLAWRGGLFGRVNPF